jgi:uncharacterized protein YggL (DUF469 family)
MRKRLRKKLRLGEFECDLLPIAIELREDIDTPSWNGFIDRFIRCIELNELQFGGGGKSPSWSGFAVPVGRETRIRGAQFENLSAWLSDQAEVVRFRLWPVMRDSDACRQQKQDSSFPSLAENDA